MKLVGNWYQKLIKVACDAVGHKQDYRFRPWVKTVDSVDREKTNTRTGRHPSRPPASTPTG